MSEKATFCPRCGHMHIGVCELAKADKPRQTPDRGSSSGRTSDFGSENEGSIPSPRAKSVSTVPAFIEAMLDTASTEVAEKIIAAYRDILVNYAAPAKFDKRAYQRDLMRKRRAEAKAK